MDPIFKLFKDSKRKSYKLQKYFSVYNEMFEKYVGKKITFVEIGVLDGGSLEVWKNYFGNNARIIGVDLNPECKKFETDGIEIFIGDQADPFFWKNFYEKVGNVDVILDDGGHKNKDQIITTINSVHNINNGGLLVFEDTCTSYWQKFGNPHTYSFINFSKKLIDDINYTYPDLPSFKLSLNNAIYSIRYFESFCIFYIDRNKCYKNYRVENNGLRTGNDNFVNHGSKTRLFAKFLLKHFPFLKKVNFIYFFYKNFLFLSARYKNRKLKKYFK